MTTERFTPGEIVDIAISGVRVLSVSPHCIDVEIAAERELRIGTDEGNIEITHRVPAEGIPRVGDLWRDREGDLWFASTGWDMDNNEYVSLTCTKAKHLHGWGDQIVYYVLRQYGPLTLVHREPEGQVVTMHKEVEPTPHSWPPQPGDVWDDGMPFGGSLWFACEYPAKQDDPDQTPKIGMVSVVGDSASYTPHRLLELHPEIKLVYRRKDGGQ